MDDELQDPFGKLRAAKQDEAPSDRTDEAERRRAELMATIVGRKVADAKRADAIGALGSIDPAALETVAARVLEIRTGADVREALVRGLLGRDGEEALRAFVAVLRRDAPGDAAWAVACAGIAS